MIFYDYSDKYFFSFFNFAEFSALNLRHLEIIPCVAFRRNLVLEYGQMATRKANVHTLWLFNIAMENGPFIDDFPIKASIYKGFSMAMLNNQMVNMLD